VQTDELIQRNKSVLVHELVLKLHISVASIQQYPIKTITWGSKFSALQVSKNLSPKKVSVVLNQQNQREVNNFFNNTMRNGSFTLLPYGMGAHKFTFTEKIQDRTISK
jgi:hypothetical protein